MADWAWQDLLSTVLDLTLVYIVIYRVLMLIKGTRAVPMLLGLVGIAILYVASEFWGLLRYLPTLHWLLDRFFEQILIIAIVVFQADIRRALAAFGQTQFLSSRRGAADAQAIDELVKATSSLASQGIGALIVLEREADLSAYTSEGTRLDARLSKELIYSLFVPERQNPLHDGAAVIQDGRLTVAGVFLPMSVSANIDRSYGTRHRAALGLSEETDAVVIVVSEERGTVSVAVDGILHADTPTPKLREMLTDYMIQNTASRTLFGRVKSSNGEPKQSSAPSAEDGDVSKPGDPV
jgi:diadenylate cyclase